jgi:hypothetical protein
MRRKKRIIQSRGLKWVMTLLSFLLLTITLFSWAKYASFSVDIPRGDSRVRLSVAFAGGMVWFEHEASSGLNLDDPTAVFADGGITFGIVQTYFSGKDNRKWNAALSEKRIHERYNEMSNPIVSWRDTSPGCILDPVWFVSMRNRALKVNAFIPLLILSSLTLLLWRVQRRHGVGYCAACGYSLDGLTNGVCPECGEAYGEG